MKLTFNDFSLDESLYPKPGVGEKKRYLLRKDATSELILMLWGPGAMSPIHDHAGSKCWTTILKGELVEKTFLRDTLELSSAEVIRFGQQSYVDWEEGVHQLLNETTELAYTLHLYEKPLSHCNVYDAETHRWSVLENRYDDFHGAGA